MLTEAERGMVKHVMNTEGVSWNDALRRLGIPKERKTPGRNKEAIALMKLEGIKYTEALRRVRNQTNGKVSRNPSAHPDSSTRKG